MPLPSHLKHMQGVYNALLQPPVPNHLEQAPITVTLDRPQLARMGRILGRKTWPDHYQLLITELFGEGSEAAALILQAADEAFEEQLEAQAEEERLLKTYEAGV